MNSRAFDEPERPQLFRKFPTGKFPAGKIQILGTAREGSGMAYSPEIRERAEDLYVMEGMTYSQVGGLTGVTGRQITTWSKKDKWREKRREYRRTRCELKRNIVLLRSRLLDNALDTMDPKMICAFARLENVARGRAENEEFEAGLPGKDENPPVSTSREAVLAVEEILKRKISALFARPERLTPDVIKEIKTSLDLIDRLKEHYHMDEDKPRGLSKETVNEIRRKILGCE
jgi:hypothetical protein